jgi:HK97 family phage portal protein
MAEAGFLSSLGQALAPRAKGLSIVPAGRGGWWPVIRESFAGAWQRNVEVRFDTAMSFHAVFACITLIASDIAKNRIKLVEHQGDDIWTEVESPAFSPVLRKPNSYQNRIQFAEAWLLSKLSRGNTYVLKVRDGRGAVIALHILDPDRTKPLISDDGAVFYDLNADHLAGLPAQVIVPAREIIHDRMNCLFHPLVGLSPIYACGLAAMQGHAIQNQSAKFFGNNAQPGGVLTAPAHIDDATAARLKAHWEAEYTGEKGAGRVAVLGDGLKFESMTMKATDAQLIEQLKMSAEVVCSAFHMPPYKVGVGPLPSYDNIQALNVEYYSQCLQILIEAKELCLDEGLGLDTVKENGRRLGTEVDTDNLLRMDSVAQMEVLEKASGVMTIDEKRRRVGLRARPNKEGDDVFLQQQNFSLRALAKRDAKADPFAKSGGGAAPQVDSDTDEADEAPKPEERAARVSRFASKLMQKAAASDRRSA